MSFGEDLDKTNSSIGNAISNLASLQEAITSGRGGLAEFAAVFKSAGAAAESFGGTLFNSIGALISKIPIISGLGDIVAKLGGGFSKLGGAVFKTLGFLSEKLDEGAQLADAFTGFNRELNESLYESASAFGIGIDSVKVFGDALAVDAVDKYSESFIGLYSDILPAVSAAAIAGIPVFEKFGDAIESSAGTTNIFNTAILQSKALGMEVSTYMQFLSNAMISQGLSTQDAAEQMTMFGDVARNTGFSANKIAQSLQATSDKFSKLGMSADFGRPLLEGFTNSLKSMGLGFENAIDLAGTLSDSIGNLSSNYGLAYLTFQKGGLDLGGSGTALGASISMRAKMLDAEKRGEQGTMALEMAKAMKETIAGFTGGEIITVQEAAASPELEVAYETQRQLLAKYGVTDSAAQDRTLDLLKQMDEATRRGDTDLAEQLGKDIEEGKKARGETLSYEEKLDKNTENTVIELVKSNEMMAKIVDGSKILGDSIVDLSVSIGKFFGNAKEEDIEKINKAIDKEKKRAEEEATERQRRESEASTTPASPTASNPPQTRPQATTTPAPAPSSDPLITLFNALISAANGVIDYIMANNTERQ